MAFVWYGACPPRRRSDCCFQPFCAARFRHVAAGSSHRLAQRFISRRKIAIFHSLPALFSDRRTRQLFSSMGRNERQPDSGDRRNFVTSRKKGSRCYFACGREGGRSVPLCVLPCSGRKEAVGLDVVPGCCWIFCIPLVCHCLLFSAEIFRCSS